MKNIEKLFIILVIVSTIYRYVHGIGSILFLILSINTLAILYFCLSFALFNNIKFKNIFKKSSYVNISKRRIIFSIFSGISLSIALIGVLFKIQDYPGADLLLVLGLFASISITIIALWKNNKVKGNFYFNILKRTAIISLIIITLMKIPLKNLLNWQYPNDPEYVEAVIKAYNNSDNDSLWQNVKIERKKMQAKENEDY